jgi:ATP-dependent Clp protease protease subunit
MNFPPNVIERSGRDILGYDIYSRLLKDRIVFLGTDVNDDVASSIIAQFLYLNSSSDGDDINFYIMSPGGDVASGLAIYDVMQYVNKTVKTYCMGQACSMAAVLVAAGTPGHRYAMPSSRIMIHHPSTGMEGSAVDIKVQHDELQRIRYLLCEKLALHTGKTRQQIDKDSERDFFMTPEEAKKYGLVDKIVAKKNIRKKT